MRSAAVSLLAAAGFQLARQASRTGRRLRGQSEHFTQSRWARALGPRNSDLGMVFYALTGLAALSGQLRRPAVLLAVRLASLAAAALSIVLLLSLLRLRIWCRVCLLAHAINLALAFLLVRFHAGKGECASEH